MNSHMDDSSWVLLLTKLYLIEKQCMEVAPMQNIQYARIDLPTIAGVAKDPLISYIMMDKVSIVLTYKDWNIYFDVHGMYFYLIL